MNGYKSSLVVLSLAIALAVPFAKGQTLYVIEGSGPRVGQIVGQPAPGCPYPNGPLLQVFFVDPPLHGFPLVSFDPPPACDLGDVAVDLDSDRVWATDGIHFSRFDAAGNIDHQFWSPMMWALPGLVTGMGCNSLTEELWITDGANIAGIAAPAVAPWLPLCVHPGVPLGNLEGIAQDVEYDPVSDTLWIVTSEGVLANYLPDGSPVSGGSHVVTPGPFNLDDNLTGLGIDTTSYNTAGQPTFFVTDGSKVAHIKCDGSAADATFYFPNVWETVFPDYGVPQPLSGLAFSLRPVRYGFGCDPIGGPPVPRIKANGQSCSPNFTFGISLKDATPYSTAYLALSSSYFYPPPHFPIDPDCHLYVSVPFLWLLGPVPVLFDGTASITLPIPPLLWWDPAVGAVLYSQWLISRLGGGIEVSEGLSFTIGMR